MWWGSIFSPVMSDIAHVLLIVWVAFEWILRLLALFVVPRNRGPNAGVSWMVFIFLVPAVGWVAFLIFGSSRLPKNRRDAQVSLDQYLLESMQRASVQWKKAATLLDATPPDKYKNSVKLSARLTHLPLFSGNAIQPVVDYDESIQRIIDDIHAAKHYVMIEYYIITHDSTTAPLFAALEAAVQRGVRVRVLYDAYGSYKYPGRKAMIARFAAIGVEAHAMLPLQFPGKGYTRPDLRNHRKIVVIDGIVGYTGSLNMIQRDYHRRDDIVYDELVVRVEGPIAAQLEVVFLNDWLAETGEFLQDFGSNVEEQLKPRGNVLAHVIPSGPGYEYENNKKFFASLFYTAQKQITIVNPYFVPDESLISALISAAMRGVKVTLVNSEAIDQIFVAHAQRSYYEQMLKAGVSIYLYKAPTLLHAKYTIIDNDACFVGSSNMDIRSFELNQELTLTAYDEKFVATMQTITNQYLQHTTKIEKSTWLQRPPRKQLLDNLARLTSSLQ